MSWCFREAYPRHRPPPTQSTLNPGHAWFFRRRGPFFADPKRPSEKTFCRCNSARLSHGRRQRLQPLNQASLRLLILQHQQTGQSFQHAPEPNTHSIASKQARLSMGFGSPLPHFREGRHGSLFFHGLSVSSEENRSTCILLNIGGSAKRTSVQVMKQPIVNLQV